MKKIIRFVIILIGLGVIYAGVCLSLILSKTQIRYDQKVDTIVVLGSKIQKNGQPAQVTQERLKAALALAKTNPQAKIIVSGAKGGNEPEPEAKGMKDYLITQGLNRSRIVEEKRARNTYENLKYSKPLLQKGKTLLVTSDFHVYRSLFLAKRLGYTKTFAYGAKTKMTSPLSWTGYYVPEILSLGRTLIFGR